MKLNIRDFNGIPENTLSFDFFLESMEDIELEEKVHVVGKATYINGKVEISGHYSTIVKTQCVRCLKNIDLKLENDFVGTFLDEEQYRSYLKSLNAECEIDQTEIYDEIVDGVIDLAELVREYIILDLPPYPQCEPKCEDTSELDKYSNDEIDSRWQQLLQIKN